MKKTFILVILVLGWMILTAQPEQFSRVRVGASPDILLQLARAGIPVEEGVMKTGDFFETDLSQTEIDNLSMSGVQVEVLFRDISAYYSERNKGLSGNVKDYVFTDEYEVPEDFEFGAMGGHCTFDEMIVHLENMLTKYPNLITQKASLGQSIEGRELWMVKISDNPNVNESEPEVLYTALHHAREPAGLMTLLFYMYYLLENYDDDPFIQTLVDNTEMYFIPVVNPDGYVYNQTTNPNGGGMWRKNRRDNGGGTWGVDLNRNYGYMWGIDNIGSSPDPGDETYRGTAPFSEPETAAIRDFCENHEFRLAINYHTYANLLLYPWGYTEDPCPDDPSFHAFAELMTQDNHYTYGPGSTTIYITNGSSDDWMYGEQTTKELIYAFTPELGGSGDGFWCPINRIIPIARENMILNILTAAFAGNYASVSDLTAVVTSELENQFVFDIKRLGLKDGAGFTVTLEPVSPEIVSVGPPITFNGMSLMETRVDSIAFTLAGITAGHQIRFVVSLDNGDYVLSDTITKIYGEPVILFHDECNNTGNWQPGSWDITTASYFSPPSSMTDSKNGYYSNNQTNIITLDQFLDLGTPVYAQLSFRAKWEIEQGWDFVQVLASANGSAWTPLEGKYTVIGNENQAQGEPLYDGFQTSWVQEEISLEPFLGDQVKFSFLLKSDNYVTEDGFYFDDFIVMVIDGYTGIHENQDFMPVLLPVPNPAHGTVSFMSSKSLQGESLLRIFNMSGQPVCNLPVPQGVLTFKVITDQWKPGVYHYYLEQSGRKSRTGKLVVL
ncbi:MAG: immune inhibitor A [Bacteroidales bacterium]|nr:immune inhibitor A [Bacteroidales bacterium]